MNWTVKLNVITTKMQRKKIIMQTFVIIFSVDHILTILKSSEILLSFQFRVILYGI